MVGIVSFCWEREYAILEDNTGKAGQALKQVLEQYDISHNRLAIIMSVERSIINNWVEGVSEPTVDQVPDILVALETLESEAAELFLRLCLDKPGPDEQPALV